MNTDIDITDHDLDAPVTPTRYDLDWLEGIRQKVASRIMCMAPLPFGAPRIEVQYPADMAHRIGLIPEAERSDFLAMQPGVMMDLDLLVGGRHVHTLQVGLMGRILTLEEAETIVLALHAAIRLAYEAGERDASNKAALALRNLMCLAA